MIFCVALFLFVPGGCSCVAVVVVVLELLHVDDELFDQLGHGWLLGQIEFFFPAIGRGDLIKIYQDQFAGLRHGQKFHKDCFTGVLAACDVKVLARRCVPKPIRRPVVS